MSADPGDELVDVIDDEGRTIDTVPRREIRARCLPHRCVYVLVFDAAGRLFIHLRTPTKDVYPSHWDVAIGGVLAAGETFDAGARREVGEELGIDQAPEPLFPFRYADARSSAHAWVYRLSHGGPFRLQPEEIVRGEFILFAEIDARLQRHPFCPDGVAVLAEFRARGLASRAR